MPESLSIAEWMARYGGASPSPSPSPSLPTSLSLDEWQARYGAFPEAQSDSGDPDTAGLLRSLLRPDQTLLGAGKRLAEIGYNISPARLMGNPAGDAFKREGPIQEGGAEAFDILSFLAPGMGPAKGLLGAGVQGAGSAGLALAQGQSPESAMMAGGVGAAAVPAAGLLGKVLAPFASKVNKQVAVAAARRGIDLPASARSDSKLVPLAEGLAAKGIGGGGVTVRVTAATEAITKQADEVARSASTLPDSDAIGKAIASGLDRFRATWTRAKGALYDQAALPKRGLLVEAKNTVALLDEIIDSKTAAGSILKEGPVADAAFYRGLRDGLTQAQETAGWVGEKYVKSTTRVIKPIEAHKLLRAQRELTQKISASFADPFSAANKGLLKKVSATLDGELEAAIAEQAPELAEKLAKANTYYADGLVKINSAFGKTIHRLAREGKYDRIAQSIANSRMSVDDIPKIVEVAGREGAEGMRAAVIADLVGKAKSTGGQLTPQGLGRAIKNFGDDRLQALLTPEQFGKLKDLSVLSGAMQKGQKITEGSQTAFLVRMGGYPAALLTDPPKAVLALLGDAAFSRFISSKAGQRWLTTGFRPFSPEALARSLNVSAQASVLSTNR